MTSLETRLKSESSQDMSQDSIFSSKEGRWTPKIRTAGRVRFEDGAVDVGLAVGAHVGYAHLAVEA